MQIRPYGDTANDGVVQISFTLPFSHAFAKELGYDAGFGPGSTATRVASYIVQELVARMK